MFLWLKLILINKSYNIFQVAAFFVYKILVKQKPFSSIEDATIFVSFFSFSSFLQVPQLPFVKE